MSSPDERQGDVHAKCSSYYCSVGPEHSIPCNKANVLPTKILGVPLSDHPVPDLHENGFADPTLTPANSNTEVLAPVHGQLVVGVRQNLQIT